MDKNELNKETNNGGNLNINNEFKDAK